MIDEVRQELWEKRYAGNDWPTFDTLYRFTPETTYISSLDTSTSTSKNFRGSTELILIVNHANLPAQKLYQRAGFIDRGFRGQGKIGEQYIYHYFL